MHVSISGGKGHRALRHGVRAAAIGRVYSLTAGGHRSRTCGDIQRIDHGKGRFTATNGNANAKKIDIIGFYEWRYKLFVNWSVSTKKF